MRVRATHPGPCCGAAMANWAPAPSLGSPAHCLWLMHLILTIAQATNDLIASSKQVPLRHVPPRPTLNLNLQGWSCPSSRSHRRKTPSPLGTSRVAPTCRQTEMPPSRRRVGRESQSAADCRLEKMAKRRMPPSTSAAPWLPGARSRGARAWGRGVWISCSRALGTGEPYASPVNVCAVTV